MKNLKMTLYIKIYSLSSVYSVLVLFFMSYVFGTIKIELGEQEYEDLGYSNFLLHIIAKHYLKV